MAQSWLMGQSNSSFLKNNKRARVSQISLTGGGISSMGVNRKSCWQNKNGTGTMTTAKSFYCVIHNIEIGLHTIPQGLRISCKTCLFLNIFSGELYFKALICLVINIINIRGQAAKKEPVFMG